MTTIGVSVAVPDPWGASLQDYRLALGDENAAAIPTHITLLPPVDVDDSLLPAITQHLAEATAYFPVFKIHLRGTGTFRPISPVVFVNLVQGISDCEALASLVRQGPLAIEADFPYHPHVTVAHHLDDGALDQAFAELADFECVFAVESFWLYTHEESAGWTPTREFQLTPPPDR